MPERQTTSEGEGPASALVERRAFVRVASDLSITCRPSGRTFDAGWPGMVRDLSRTGVGLLLRHRFRPGTHLNVELRESTGKILRTVRVRVVHTTPILVDNHPSWLLGCAFQAPLNKKEFQALQ